MTRFPRLLTLATLLLVALAALASPPPKPNYSGTWVLNVQKSDFGPIPPPKSRTDEITQKDTRLTLVRKQVNPDGAATTVKVDCVIGGGACAVVYAQPGQLTAKAAWDGDALAIDSVLTGNGVSLNVRDVYTLSAAGKVLTIKRHISTPQGDLDATFVLDKK